MGPNLCTWMVEARIVATWLFGELFKHAEKSTVAGGMATARYGLQVHSVTGKTISTSN